jgi:hypothetical protein
MLKQDATMAYSQRVGRASDILDFGTKWKYCSATPSDCVIQQERLLDDLHIQKLGEPREV